MSKRATIEELEQEVADLQKTKKNMTIGLAVVGIGFVGVLIWAFAT